MKGIIIWWIFPLIAVLGFFVANGEENMLPRDDISAEGIPTPLRTGSIDLMDLTCDAGYYKRSANIKCQLCPVGTISKAGASKCTGCPAGTKTTDHKSCKKCAAGKYSGALSAKCYPCGAGKVSEEGASNCTTCTAGQYASRSDNICKPCANGTYSLGSADSCTKCAVGSFSDPGASLCIQCTPGTNFIRGYCQQCEPSFYSPDPNIACAKCPADTYENRFGATACRTCDATKGLVVQDGQLDCECPNGGYYDYVLNTCSVCKPGYRMTTGGGGCEVCGPKTYAPRVGSQLCAVCNDNKLVNAERTRCDYCPASFGISPTTGQCAKCPKGQYSKGDIGGCRDCSELSEVNDAQTGCLPVSRAPTTAPIERIKCVAGQGYTKTSPESCVDCGPGYMSLDSTCIPCPVGAYSDIARAASCTTCGASKVVSADRTKCEWCEASYYKQDLPQDYPVTIPSREAVCMKCPPGTYSTSQGTGCLECPNYTPVNTAQTGCSPVPPGPIVLPNPPRAAPGKVWDAATQSIKDCEAGYKKKFSFESCTACEVGYYTALPGSAMCSICDSSKVVTGGKSCQSCPSGYSKTPHKFGVFPYADEVEAVCVKCPPYFISNGGVCTRCPKGKVPSADQSYCTLPANDYCGFTKIFDSEIGECVPCGPGTFYTQVRYLPDGSTRPGCGACPERYYQPYRSETAECMECPKGMATGKAQDDCYFCEASYFQRDYHPRRNPEAPACFKCYIANTYSVYADTKCHICPPGKKVNAGKTGCE